VTFFLVLRHATRQNLQLAAQKLQLICCRQNIVSKIDTTILVCQLLLRVGLEIISLQVSMSIFCVGSPDHDEFLAFDAISS